MNVDKILHPTDFSACARGAFAHAAFLAERCDAELYVVHAVNWLAGDSVHSPLQHTPEAKALHERFRDIVQDMMADAVASYEGGKLHTERVRVVSAPAPKILEYAEQRDIDLIAMGTHGRRGLDRALSGSVAEEVVRKAGCPVLTICEGTEKGEKMLRHILVPVDFSGHSERALAHAVALAQEYDAALELLHVIDYRPLSSLYGFASTAVPEATPDIEAGVEGDLQAAAENVRAHGVEASAEVGHGPPAAAILDAAERDGVDLIVQASHGRTGLKRFLMGSVAEVVMRAAAGPVFTVKSFGKSLIGEGGAQPEMPS